MEKKNINKSTKSIASHRQTIAMENTKNVTRVRERDAEIERRKKIAVVVVVLDLLYVWGQFQALICYLIWSHSRFHSFIIICRQTRLYILLAVLNGAHFCVDRTNKPTKQFIRKLSLHSTHTQQSQLYGCLNKTKWFKQIAEKEEEEGEVGRENII